MPMGASCAGPPPGGGVSCECALEGPPPVRTRLRVGSASGFLDAPIQFALAEGNVSALSVNLNWVKCPQDTGAVVSMLAAGLIDMALMFTEDAVSCAVSSSCVRICGTFAATPRSWGVHVPGASKAPSGVDLEGCSLGVSDDNAGPLMVSVLRDRPGWELLGRMPRLQFPSLRRACEAMGRDIVRAVLWERRAARGLVACGEWDLVHEEAMPWPALAIVASREALYNKSGAIRHFVNFACSMCKEFKADANGRSQAFLVARYGIQAREAEDWLTTSWPCECAISEAALRQPLEHLKAAGLMAADRIVDPAKLVAREICDIRASPVVRRPLSPGALPAGGLTPASPPIGGGVVDWHTPGEEDFDFAPEPTTSVLSVDRTAPSEDAGTAEGPTDDAPVPAG